MDDFVLDLLANTGYEGPFLDKSVAIPSIAAGPASDEFQDVVIWLTEEIRGLGKVDEQVSKSDPSTFILELSAFLKELMCPYGSLTTGHASERLKTEDSKYLLLEFLLTELMSFKMCEGLKPQNKSNVITLNESPVAAALKDISITLGLGKPPNNISTPILFQKINTRLDEMIKVNGKERVGNAFFIPKKNLSMEQWNKLDRLQKDLDTEYDLRRKMLLTRLDVTIQSFKWSLKIHGKEGQISERYSAKRKQLESLQTGGNCTDLAALLAARDTLAVIEKTSSASVRKNTKSKIQRHIMGQVPDRGGRAYEHNPPPPEMPSWQQRNTGGGQRGGFGGGDRGGRGRGGGGGGGYQQNQNNQRGGYDNRGGGGGNWRVGSTSFDNNSRGGGGGGFDNRGGGSGYDNRGGGGGYDNRGRGGGSRVQGGWAPQKDYQGGNQGYGGRGDDGRGGGGGGGYMRSDSNDQQQNNNDRRGSGGGSNYNRGGSSNYNRGGRR